MPSLNKSYIFSLDSLFSMLEERLEGKLADIRPLYLVDALVASSGCVLAKYLI
jgi:hypothetical protein